MHHERYEYNKKNSTFMDDHAYIFLFTKIVGIKGSNVDGTYTSIPHEASTYHKGIKSEQDNTKIDEPMVSVLRLASLDSKERKRKQDRERYAKMDDQKKIELLKKQREARQKSKGEVPP